MKNIDQKYNKYIDYLYNYLPHFSKKLGLENITNTLDMIDNPQRKFKSIHVAGTNGKGSVCATLSSIIDKSGYSVGMFTSPHLLDFRERIQVNNKKIPKEKVVEILDYLKPIIEKTGATFFETVTAIAFLYFAEQHVDYAVVEVGMGGRLDATNLVEPVVTVITNISLDHVAKLGNTLEKIAYEKSGIIKRGIPVITATENKDAFTEIEKICIAKESPLIDVLERCQWQINDLSEEGTCFDLKCKQNTYKNLTFSLLGRHQVINASIAITVLNYMKGFKVDEETIRTGLETTIWPGRLQIYNKQPKILLDGAHNPAGVDTLYNALNEIFHYDRLFLIFGVLEGKIREKMLPQMGEISDVFIATQPRLIDRKLLSYRSLAEEMRKYKKEVIEKPNIKKSIQYTLQHVKKNDLICIAGSLYLLGEAIKELDILLPDEE